MKTYSRKNSSYLKKAFIASNFNEMCRLCLSELDLGLTPIFQEFSKISYQEWIQYSVDVLIEEGDGLPPNICEECLALVEQTYLFKKKCKASDSKLREHLELLELNKEGKLSETGLIDLSEDHRNLFKREKQSESKCDESSAVDSGGTDNQLCNKEQQEKEQVSQKQSAEEEVLEQPEKDTIVEETAKETKGELVKEPEADVDSESVKVQEKVVKRYILKGEKRADDQEEDLTVCEVVPLDSKTEQSVKMDTHTTVESPSENGLESEVSNPQETKIQEIYQLWDNEEGDEEEEEEEEVDEEEEEEEEQEEIQEEQECEKNEDEIMILDVSWEENTDKNEKKQDTEVLEVDVEQNGVVQVHRVYTNKLQSESSEPKQEIKTFNKTEGMNFKCFACGKQFLRGIELKAHLSKVHHEVSDAAFCETCGKSFVCMNNLKRHMAIHTGYKPHKCKICGRTFSQGSILKRHVFTHETLKPFNCQICGKGYTQKMNLLAHFRNHGFRTEGENFSCQFCSKSFVHQSGLSRHVKLHKGVRFSCEHCKKSFADSSALARHVKAIHLNK